MKKSIFNWLASLAMLIVVASCQKIVPEALQKDKASSSNLSLNEVKAILGYQIGTNNIKSVVSSEQYALKSGKELLTMVKFLNNTGESKSIGILRTFDELGALKQIITLECKGNCSKSVRCTLQGPIEDYVQCSCSSCVMQVSLIQDVKSGFDALKPKSNDILDLAKVSYEKTFKTKSENLRISKIEINDDKNGIATLVTYVDGENTSTFMVINPKKGQYLNILGEKVSVSVVIDCKGTCDCRERYIFNTGAIECTCADCVMDIRKFDEN